jgi:hypothetical protein
MLTKLRCLLYGTHRAQTMTEYVLVLSAVAVAAFVTYELMGQDINSLTSWRVDSYLTGS